jgi:hypothetical protein
MGQSSIKRIHLRHEHLAVAAVRLYRHLTVLDQHEEIHIRHRLLKTYQLFHRHG